jgi:hypothetical protein
VELEPFPLAGQISICFAAGQGHHIGSAASRACPSPSFRPQAASSREERVEIFHTYAGTALLVPYGAEPLLLFGSSAYIVLPKVGLPNDTPPPADAPRHSIEGWSQGAVMDVGNGRLAVFGEAAAVSAQRYANGDVQGMNDPRAAQNKQVLLNVVHWLSGVL